MSRNDRADKTATIANLRVFVITGSSNFIKIREAGKATGKKLVS